jgi:hypothetical protein
MPPPARAFWRRYYLQTVLLPAYAQALLYYGAAGLAVWGLGHPHAAPALLVGLYAGAGVLLILALAATVLSGTSAFVRGLAARRIPAAADVEARLAALQSDGQLPALTPVVFELGATPLLALGAGAYELWVSTHTLRATPDAALRCLIAHERAHAVTPRGCGAGLLLWLLAIPACWLTRAYPLCWAALAALHVSLWLRWQQWQTDRREAAADRRAAELCGRSQYAAALAAYLATFDEPGHAALLRRRLRAMGLDEDEIRRLGIERKDR